MMTLSYRSANFAIAIGVTREKGITTSRIYQY
jgi:hypothetical protein